MKAVGDCVHIADFIELEEQLGICRTRSVDTPYRKLRMDWTKFSWHQLRSNNEFKEWFSKKYSNGFIQNYSLCRSNYSLQ